MFNVKVAGAITNVPVYAVVFSSRTVTADSTDALHIGRHVGCDKASRLRIFLRWWRWWHNVSHCDVIVMTTSCWHVLPHKHTRTLASRWHVWPIKSTTATLAPWQIASIASSRVERWTSAQWTNSSTLPPPDIVPVEFTISLADVKRKLSCVKVHKATGPDELRDFSSHLASPVCAIYKASVGKGFMPSRWKEANVVPIMC